MNKSLAPINLKWLYTISFIEGGVVMVTEITGAKLLTPFFGASLYSWASTLAITLFALMAGYYAGGYATTKARFSSSDKIVRIFLLSGVTVFLMPSLANFIMKNTISFSFFSGLIISEFVFLFFPIFLMGMISPMIIFQITKKAEQSGRSAGNIYAISTFGGILFTLVFGFLIIPNHGITLPLRLLGLGVSVMGFFLLLKEKLLMKKVAVTSLLMLILIAIALYLNKRKDFVANSNMKLITYSEGLLGELKVVDHLSSLPNGNPVVMRKLKTNNIQQNYVFRDKPEQSLNYYVNFTRQLIKSFPRKESALLIGLGAGSLYKILSEEYYNVETVEIDKRIYDIGVKYFGMLPHKNNVITDGRYFINVTKHKYDLIILDAIIGESVPGQLITIESFKKCYAILNEGGSLIIENGGLLSLADNSFVPSIFKTLHAAGFEVSIFNPLLSNSYGDAVFLATKNKLDVGKITIGDDFFLTGGALSKFELPLTTFDNSTANILTDDINNFDILLKKHYFEIRKGIRKELAKVNI